MAELESIEAVTLEAADGVDTGAVVADVGVTGTLVCVRTGLTRRSELIAVVTHALETALEVVTVTVLAYAGPLHTLVYV